MNRSSHQAPDAAVTLSDGTEMRLSDLWGQRMTVLVFLRHLG